MTAPLAPGDSSLPLSLLGRVDRAGDRFEEAWDAGQRRESKST
jgi:hypothetical protein